MAALYDKAQAVASLQEGQAMTGGKDVFGNPTGTDVQGNTDDKNSQGERPKDGAGNAPKDIYGNESGTEGDKE